MGFAESLGYLIIILVTIAFMYFVIKLFPYLSCVLVTMGLYHYIVTSMAIPGGSAEEPAHVFALLIYTVGWAGGFFCDMVLMGERYKSMMHDDFDKRR